MDLRPYSARRGVSSVRLAPSISRMHREASMTVTRDREIAARADVPTESLDEGRVCHSASGASRCHWDTFTGVE